MNRIRRGHLIAAGSFSALLVGMIGLMAGAQEATEETGHIATLMSDAGWAEKQAACRALRQIGTACAVPALSALLPDPELSSLARFALESMPCAEAGKALRDALNTTQDAAKAGVIISLGVRRDAGAAPALPPLLRDANPDIARAAAGALGRIATPYAALALLSFRGESPEALRPAVHDGLLASVQYLIKGGDRPLAAAICEVLSEPALPLGLRLGAFKGLIEAEPASAPLRLIAALGGTEPLLRDLAAQCIADSKGPNATAAFARALPSLPVGGQIALLGALSGRKDPAACQAIAQAVDHSERDVRLGAIKALGVLGGAREAKLLAALLPSEDADVVEAAHAALTIMTPGEVNAALAECVSGAALPVRAALLDILMQRHAEQSVPLALDFLKEGEPSMRAVAFKALAVSGGPDQLGTLLGLFGEASEAERGEAEKALGSIAGRNRESALPVLLGAAGGASPALHMALLRILSGLGGPQALEAVQAGVSHADPVIADESVRLLAEWPSGEAAAPLLGLIQGGNASWKLSGLRGYTRLARTGGFSSEERSVMLNQAMASAGTSEEKMIVLSAWGAFPALASIDALLPHLDDAAVQNEASVALISVASELVKQDPSTKPRVVESLQSVTAKCADPDIRARAESVLSGLS